MSFSNILKWKFQFTQLNKSWSKYVPLRIFLLFIQKQIIWINTNEISQTKIEFTLKSFNSFQDFPPALGSQKGLNFLPRVRRKGKKSIKAANWYFMNKMGYDVSHGLRVRSTVIIHKFPRTNIIAIYILEYLIKSFVDIP